MAPTVAARPAASRLARRHVAVGGLLTRRPETWLYGVAIAAGVVVVGLAVADGGGGGAVPGSPGWGEPSSLAAAWGAWMAMVAAMMLPVIAPQAHYVALRSLRRRRHRAIAGYLAGYLAVWALVGTVLVVVLGVTGVPHPPAGLAVAALLGAGTWQVAEPRRRILRRCGSLRLGAPEGFAADRDCATAGWRAGLRCAFTCGPVMVATAAAHHQPLVLGAVIVLLLSERAPGPNPERRAGRRLEAWALVGLAAAIALGAAI